MQNVQHQDVKASLPFESLSHTELANHCECILDKEHGLPERAMRELIKRVFDLAAPNDPVYTKYK